MPNAAGACASGLSVTEMAGVSTGCGDTSTNVPWPVPTRVRTARSNSTGSRSEANQYSASISGPVIMSPLIAEIIGMRVSRGAMPSRADRISSRSSST
ncbi:hypothetical protein STBA_57340 [Streptomyces sp. MP131-18]|nr:hypothetical protein STBA_57340 [Streptomyces sp. MP131-18]